MMCVFYAHFRAQNENNALIGQKELNVMENLLTIILVCGIIFGGLIVLKIFTSDNSITTKNAIVNRTAEKDGLRKTWDKFFQKK